MGTLLSSFYEASTTLILKSEECYKENHRLTTYMKCDVKNPQQKTHEPHPITYKNSHSL